MTWNVVVVKTSPHKKGMELTLRISPQGARWIKFATTLLVLEDLDEYMLGFLRKRLTPEPAVDQADEPLF